MESHVWRLVLSDVFSSSTQKASIGAAVYILDLRFDPRNHCELTVLADLSSQRVWIDDGLLWHSGLGNGRRTPFLEKKPISTNLHVANFDCACALAHQRSHASHLPFSCLWGFIAGMQARSL